MTFGERLTNLRKEYGYKSRNDFANKLGIPSTTLRNYETDAREPGHTFLKKISEFFNVSVDYLLCLTDEREILHTFQLRSREQDVIEKYRYIENHCPEGIKTVNYVLDREYTIAEFVMKLEEEHRENATNNRTQTLEEPKEIVRQKKDVETSKEDALYSKLSQEDLIALGNRPKPFQPQAFVSNGKDEAPNNGELSDSREGKLQLPEKAASKEDRATIKNSMKVLRSERSGKTGKNWSI